MSLGLDPLFAVLVIFLFSFGGGLCLFNLHLAMPFQFVLIPKYFNFNILGDLIDMSVSTLFRILSDAT